MGNTHRGIRIRDLAAIAVLAGGLAAGTGCSKDIVGDLTFECTEIGQPCGDGCICVPSGTTGGPAGRCECPDVPSDAGVDGPDACQGGSCPPAKLDVLFVIDASTSMCQEQQGLAGAFRSFLDGLRANGLDDVQVAVTSSNVCAPDQGTCNSSADCAGGRECKDIGGGYRVCLRVGAVRGKFLYQPAGDFPPACVEMRTVPCLTDAECNTYSARHPDDPLPDGDGGNWVCEGPPLGSAANLWTCDLPPEVKQYGVEDDYAPGDLLFAVSSQCRYRCDRDADPGQCARVFGQATSGCVYPGNDPSKAGCMLPPATAHCPPADQGPKILNNNVADHWLRMWMAGEWAGDPGWDPQWKQLPAGDSDADFAAREAPRARVFEQLFQCMATLGVSQTTCGLQEQGLRAAWMALDPEGENSGQAQAFLRHNAYLLIVIVGDEDDCSAPEYQKSDGRWDNRVPSDQSGWCACMRDENGCTAAGECDPAACLTNGKFDVTKCPLYSTSRFVNQLRTLKPDAAMVAFAAVTGDFLPGSATTPGTDLAAIRQRYFECRCNTKASSRAPFTYACLGAAGQASLGARYAAVAEVFAQGGRGTLSNLCAGTGFESALQGIAALMAGPAAR